MPLPKPDVGLIIKYRYLWSMQADGGEDEGRKDRPCLIVSCEEGGGGKMRVRVAPVTHTPPKDPAKAIELDAAVKKRLGMDEQPSWIICKETNEFDWPGPDVQPEGDCGMVAPAMVKRVHDLQEELDAQGELRHVERIDLCELWHAHASDTAEQEPCPAVPVKLKSRGTLTLKG